MSKKQIPPIGNGEITLRLLTPEDLSLTRQWRNRDDIRRCFFCSDVVTETQHRHWHEKYQLRSDDYVFIIHETQSLRSPVGQVALYNIDWLEKKAEYGRLMIGDIRVRGKGFAQEATRLLLEFAYEEWGLRIIYLDVYASNHYAIRVYKASGFVEMSMNKGVVRMQKELGAG